jgi:hypothetical protein
MAEYLVLIYEDEQAFGAGGPEVWDQVMAAHMAFGEKYAEKIKGGNALQPVASATSVHNDSSGAQTVTDGPFAETKETLGGYYLIEVADLDEALQVAKECPARFGGVEVRPVMVFD